MDLFLGKLVTLIQNIIFWLFIGRIYAIEYYLFDSLLVKIMKTGLCNNGDDVNVFIQCSNVFAVVSRNAVVFCHLMRQCERME